MQAVSLRPQKRLIVQKRVALYALVVLIAFVPVLALPLTLVMSLFSCPLIKADKKLFTWLALPLPTIIAIIHSPALYHSTYFSGLLLMALIPPIMTSHLSNKETRSWIGFLACLVPITLVTAYTLSGLCVGEGYVFRPLTTALADFVENTVMEHPQRTQLLYQSMAAGLLPVPQGYERVTLLQFTIDPVFLKEVRLMLRTRVISFVETGLPSLLIQSCIIISLFINLRIQRMWGAVLLMKPNEPQKISVAMAPSYSHFRLAGKDHLVMALFLFFYLFFGASDGFVRILAQLMYYTFQTAYQLVGGAVVCSMIMRKNPERRILAGIAAAALYLFMPLLLFVLGCFENMFSFRSHAEDDKEERENNEEEEP